MATCLKNRFRRAHLAAGVALLSYLFAPHGRADDSQLPPNPYVCPLGQVDFPAAPLLAQPEEVGALAGRFGVTVTGQATYRSQRHKASGAATPRRSIQCRILQVEAYTA